jgi:peptidyl-Asp metalloendopeptidase
MNMRKILLCLATAFVVPGCTSEWDGGKSRAASLTVPVNLSGSDGLAISALPLQKRSRNARMPDRGSLIVYDRTRAPIRRAAFTHHAIDLSEAHALNAARRGGKIEVQTPLGKAMSFAYARHIDHGDGNWTWVGRTAEGLDAVITFGTEAVVGRISQANTESLRLVFSEGRNWLVEADPSKLRHPGSHRSPDHDVAIIPKAALEAVRAKQNAKGGVTASAVSAATGPSNTIDVVLGYTPGFVAQNSNSTSAAVTVLTNRIELANQAFASSLVTPRVRLVRTLQVNYTDTTNNGTALDQLSGQTCTTTSCTTIPVPVELQPLRNAREQFGGDIVSLVRPLKEPEHGGCGIAWLLGPNNTTIDNTDAPFAYSVVSEGSDVRESDGFTYSCPAETLAHEMAHNMGQQHNVEDSGGDAGTHPYSYGYREAASNGFYTIMAYPLTSSAQFMIPYFGNPNVNYASTGRPTGTAAADNARSLNQAMLLVAQFRNTIVPFSGDPNLATILKQGASGKTEIHTLSFSSGYTAFSQHIATALSTISTDFAWDLLFGDYNGDGVKDMYIIYREGASNSTEVHILNGQTNYQTFLLNTGSALGRTGTANDWAFSLGDYNEDGKPDLYAIKRNGTSNKTEVNILNGTNFGSFLLQIATPVGQTGSNGAWEFEVGRFDVDNKPDLFMIYKPGSSAPLSTEVHILSGASNYQSFILNRRTALGPSGTDYTWNFKLGDYDRDGVSDVYSILRQGSSGKIEIHVLDGKTSYTTFSLHRATALPSVPSSNLWEFEILD